MEFQENQVRQVGPGVWIRVAVDNIAWCDLGEFAVVIDALEDAGQAGVVRDLIRETTGRELKYIVNTHWDADHIACNPQWKSEGAIAIAHKSCADSADTDAGRPDIWFDDRAALRGQDGKGIEMQWLGGTHTPWDTVLWFPHAQVLHIADLFGWGLIPCQPTPAKIARLREVYDRLVEYDAQAVIVGHGPIATREHLIRFRLYFEEMMSRVPALIAEGKSDEEILTEVQPPSDMAEWWRFTDWKHAKNVALIREFHLS